jgi:7-cyano-7-deazaguanine synthase in queuosine biosynthesis
MLFNVALNTYVIIRAYPESEKEKYGYRSESPYPLIRLKLENNYSTLIFKYPIINIHPDILGLLCIISFYPFIHDSVTFPMDVSPKFAETIENMWFYTVIDAKYVPERKVIVTNVNKNLAPYKWGKNKALAYGGGLDSTATLILFQNVNVIHEKIMDIPDKVIDFLQEIEDKWTKWKGKTYCIESNNKTLCNKSGWTTWVSCISTSVILAQKLGIGYILLGSSLGSYYSNGEFKEYHENEWTKLFRKLGLQVFSPIAGLSELSLGKIILKTYPNWIDKITYCIKGENGSNCKKCLKCFRRYVLTSYLKGEEIDYTRYKLTEEIIGKLGITFNWIYNKTGDKDLVEGYYKPAINLIPSELRNNYKTRIENMLR